MALQTFARVVVAALPLCWCATACTSELEIRSGASVIDAGVIDARDRDAFVARDAQVIDAHSRDGNTSDATIRTDGATMRDGSQIDASARLICEGEGSVSPQHVLLAPSLDAYRALTTMIPTFVLTPPAALVFDPAACNARRYEWSYIDGSGAIDIGRSPNGDCGLWIFEERENPQNTGLPAIYCGFPTQCDAFQIEVMEWGPEVVSEWCRDTNFCLSDDDCPHGF